MSIIVTYPLKFVDGALGDENIDSCYLKKIRTKVHTNTHKSCFA